MNIARAMLESEQDNPKAPTAYVLSILQYTDDILQFWFPILAIGVCVSFSFIMLLTLLCRGMYKKISNNGIDRLVVRPVKPQCSLPEGAE